MQHPAHFVDAAWFGYDAAESVQPKVCHDRIVRISTRDDGLDRGIDALHGPDGVLAALSTGNRQVHDHRIEGPA